MNKSLVLLKMASGGAVQGILLLTQIAGSICWDSFCDVRTSVLGFWLGLMQFFCLFSTCHCSAVSAFNRLVAGMPAGAPWSLFSSVDLSGAL